MFGKLGFAGTFRRPDHARAVETAESWVFVDLAQNRILNSASSSNQGDRPTGKGRRFASFCQTADVVSFDRFRPLRGSCSPWPSLEGGATRTEARPQRPSLTPIQCKPGGADHRLDREMTK